MIWRFGSLKNPAARRGSWAIRTLFPSVGHGVGLELNELPLIGRGVDTVLVPGMTFSLEPKFVIPGEGIVGIENTFLVTEKGLKRLNRFPDDIAVC